MTKEELDLYGHSQYEQMDYIKHLVGTGEAQMYDNRKKQAILDYFNMRQPKVSQAYQTNKTLKEITDKIDAMKPKDKAAKPADKPSTPVGSPAGSGASSPAKPASTPADSGASSPAKPSTPVGSGASSPAKPASTPAGSDASSPANPSTPAGSGIFSRPASPIIPAISPGDSPDIDKTTSADISPTGSSATGAGGLLGGMSEIGLGAKDALEEMGMASAEGRTSVWDALSTIKWGSLDAIDDVNFQLAKDLLELNIINNHFEPEEAEANDPGIIARINDLIANASLALIVSKPEELFTGLCESLGIEASVIAKYYNHPDLYGESHITASEDPSAVGDASRAGSSIHPLASGRSLATGVEDVEKPYRVNLNKKSLAERTVTRDPRFPNKLFSNYDPKPGPDGDLQIHKGLIELRELGLLDENFVGTKKVMRNGRKIGD